jgi:hypothetical protein
VSRRSLPKFIKQAKRLRERWRVSPGLRNLLTALALFSGVLVLGVFGYWVLAGWPFLDALYMVIITIFGVGFGEVRPINTPGLTAIYDVNYYPRKCGGGGHDWGCGSVCDGRGN